METSAAAARTIAQSVDLSAALEGLPKDFGKGKKVGLAQMHYTNAFRIAETNSVLKAFEGAGSGGSSMERGEERHRDPDFQRKRRLAQDIDYLLLPPKEEEGLVPALEAAKAAGVPVILLTAPPTAPRARIM